MHSGYRTYQLEFGKNLNLPSVITDNLPALEVFAKHINPLHSA